MILFVVRPKGSDVYVVVWAIDREAAKHAAEQRISRLAWKTTEDWAYAGASDEWDVIPITPADARVYIDIDLTK